MVVQTKEYIKHLLENGLDGFEGNEDLPEGVLSLDELYAIWARDIESSSGENGDEDDVEFEVERSGEIFADGGYEQSFDFSDADLNSNMQYNGGHKAPDYFDALSIHDHGSRAVTNTTLLSDNFGGLVRASSLTEGTEISYHHSIQHSAEPVNTNILLQNLIGEPSNRGPEALYDFFIAVQDAGFSANVLDDNGSGADIDADGDAITVVAGTFATDAGGVVTLSADGSFVYTPVGGYSGADGFSYEILDGNGGRDTAQVGIHVSAGEVVTHIDFSTATITDYGVEHNFSDVFSVEDDGATLRLEDNTWKDIALNYTVTANTVLEFDYFSTVEGQIQGIGFDGNESISEGYTVTLQGTQGWGIRTYDNYDVNDGWVHYTIDVGDFYTGDFNRLFFVNDDDDYVGSNGSFSNIAIYELGTEAADTITGSSGAQTLQGLGGDDLIYGMDGDDILYGGSGIDFLFGGEGADTFVFDDLNDSDYVQDFDESAGDVLDISALLSGYDSVTDAIADFVTVTDNGTDTFVHVDADGGADNFVQVATLHGVTNLGDADTLEDSGALIVV